MAPLFDLAWFLRSCTPCYLVTTAARLPARFKHTQMHRSGSSRDDGAGLWSLIPLTPDLTLCLQFWVCLSVCMCVCMHILLFVYFKCIKCALLFYLCLWVYVFFSHASPSVDRLVHHFGPGWNIPTTTWWIAMKFGSDFHGCQMMNPNYFGDPFAFPVAPPAGQSFHLSCEISQHLLDGLAQKCI